MITRLKRTVLGAAILGMVSIALATPAAQAQPVAEHASCGQAAVGHVRCFSTWEPIHTDEGFSTASVAKPPKGITAADIRSVYRLPATGGQGKTVAIVDAYDNPHAEGDLKVYRRAAGLSACTTANGCFRKVNSRGGVKPPAGDAGWGGEIDLDLQAVSAACPDCSILLVEAGDTTDSAMGKAVNTAVRMGADVVSNSYGRKESGDMMKAAKKYFTHPGVPIVVSSGDESFTAPEFPAVLRTSLAVGGTTLTRNTFGGWSEKVWNGAGSGCSAWVPKPAWQKDKHCQMRTVADISALADNFAVYDSYGLGEDNGWITVGGTSLAAPLISGMIALTGHPQTVTPARVYQHRSVLHDVVRGSNGECGSDYLCTGTSGYDGPSGLGSPRGLRVFS